MAHSAHMILWISMQYQTNYCIFFPISKGLVGSCDTALTLQGVRAFVLSAVCLSGKSWANPSSYPKPASGGKQKIQKSGQGCSPRPPLLLFTFGAAAIIAMLRVQMHSRRLRAPHQALVQIKYLLAKVFIVKAKEGHENET